MQTVIGLGQAGCNIADQFKQYSQYKTIKLDVGLKKTKTSFGLKRQASPELYEEKLPKGIIKYLQEEVMPETLFITSCGTVSGASLSILEKTINLVKELQPENHHLLNLELPNYEINF